MNAPSPELADQVIARLNDICKNEEALAVVGRLLDKRVAAPAGTFPLADELGAVGLLHVLNAIVGVDDKGHGLIAVVLTDAGGYATGFQRYAAPPEPAPVEEETKPATPQAKTTPPPAS